MASTISSPTFPLKGKLVQVRNILDDANRKLQEEVSRYEVFATKTSATVNSGTYQQRINNNKQEVPSELVKTISDISTLKSVLSCPIFNRIVNVTDTLDKLSYQLNLHPSIGPSDINIDTDGELILAPPLEPSPLNNLINNGLETNDCDSVLSVNRLEDLNNTQINSQLNNTNGVQRRKSSEHFAIDARGPSCYNEAFMSGRSTNNQHLRQSPLQNLDHHGIAQKDVHAKQVANCYNQEKLVANGGINAKTNGNSRIEYKIGHNDTSGDRSRRLYKTSCHSSLGASSDQNIAVDMKNADQISTAINQNDSPMYNNGYSNEMYKAANELVAQPESIAIENQNIKETTNFYTNSNVSSANMRCQLQNQTNRIQQNSEHHYLRNSCSPSTSVGSTVRLADECDSGASSYQSHTAKITSFNEHAPEPRGPEDVSSSEKVDRMEQELISELSPDMERIKVTLEKDQNGLGITIAGYTCEKEEISGIFVKSITPNSPADLSGKIRTLDQIFAVNGRELLGFSNPEAVNVLRNTGKTVTLELMRYLAESKYQKLQTALAHAVPTMSARGIKIHNHDNVLGLSGNAMDSSPAVAQTAEDASATKLKPIATISKNITAGSNQGVESIYKNEQLFAACPSTVSKSPAVSHCTTSNINQIPVAAQRAGTNKVIETKQGARNTIEIKSPIYRLPNYSETTNTPKRDVVDTGKRDHENFVKNESDELAGVVPTKEPEWERNAEFVELYKDTSQGLGFTVKEYADPKDPNQSIIMITSITPGGQAERDGRLCSGDLLIFVDDTDLKGASLNETVKALKRTNGQVRLGVLKLKSLNQS